MKAKVSLQAAGSAIRYLARRYSAREGSAYRRLRDCGLRPVRVLGQGKDGVVWLALDNEREVVVKHLSDYGRYYLPLTEYFLSQRLSSRLFYSPEIRRGELLIYPWEPLTFAEPSAEAFLDILQFVADVQIELLGAGLVLWDLGFSAPNYMQTATGEMRLIDYGGNGFLFVDPVAAQPFVHLDQKPNLIRADGEFLALQILLHVCTFLFGRNRATKLAVENQLSRDSFRESRSLIEKLTEGTFVEPVRDLLLDGDPLTADCWKRIGTLVSDIRQAGGRLNLERADVRDVEYLPGGVTVRGYQNYSLSRDGLVALEQGHHWALSTHKLQALDAAVTPHAGEISSHLDIGSNLGMLVFHLNGRYGFTSLGIDYNPEYVRICNSIAAHLGLDARFETLGFSDLGSSYDLVTMFGLIHHLYHRTESYGSLAAILDQLAAVTSRYALVEFPTEDDPKARKWTAMPMKAGRSAYSLQEFLDRAAERFAGVERVGEVSSTRPVYLLSARSGRAGA